MTDNNFEDRVRSERLGKIEERLERLEKFLNLRNEPKPEAAAPAAAAPAPAPAAAPQPAAPAGTAYRAVQSPPRSGGTWLGTVAVICFVLAAGFIIKLSLESGWLTPERQIGLAVVFGLVLVVSGLALLGADREYASYLPAAGVIVLYAAVFSAHRFYALLSFESAIALSAMVSGLCVWLYTQIREDVYPVAAAAGSYLAPALLGFTAATPFGMYYYLVCTLGFSVISAWVRSRTLTAVAAYLGMMMTAFAGLSLHDDALTSLMLALNFVALSAGVYAYTRLNGQPLTEKESMALLPALLFFYVMEYYFVDRLVPGLAPWLSLAFAAVILGLYLSARQRLDSANPGSGAMVFAFVSVVCFHSFYLELLPGDLRPWLFVVLVAALCAAPWGGGKLAPELRAPALAVLAVLLIEYTSMTAKLLGGGPDSWLAVSMVSVGALWALIHFREAELSERGSYFPVLGAAHMLAVTGLYRLTKDAGSLHVSSSWLLYAAGVIAVAFSRRDEAMARSAVFVLGFAAAKALLYDAAAAPTTVRIFCLLLTGAVLYGAGFFLRQIAAWKKEPAK